MNEYLQFTLMYVCRETERTNEEFGFVIPKPLFGFQYKKKQSSYRPGVAQRIPGNYVSQIS